MGAWDTFFQGELGAAAALAGLLFVSVSVNQTKILELGRMADRGLEALNTVPRDRGVVSAARAEPTATTANEEAIIHERCS